MRKEGFKNILITIGVTLAFTLLLMPSFVKALSAEDLFEGTIVLSHPTKSDILISVTAPEETQVYVTWGLGKESLKWKSKTVVATELKPAEITMNKLSGNKTFYYKLFFKKTGAEKYASTQVYSFQTPKTAGNSFSFAIQSDSHLLNKADKALYKKSMETIAEYKPDFMFDLGDTFLHDQDKSAGGQDAEKVRTTTLQQRSYFDLVTRTAPLFLTIGNHEGEYGYSLDGTSNNLAAMSTLSRKLYFPNPTPNNFYSGNKEIEKAVGMPENYYAFQWGDALFVSIDPYRYTLMNPYNDKDSWGWTLGKTQYDWFKKTLESSKAKYKFVFAHHAIGNIRGGAEIAKLFEWGGYDRNGEYLFDEKRPGWGKPIHQIMKDAGVTIFFQGHDHLFAREVVDGIVYQELPKPAEKIADKQSNYDAYKGADVLMNSGFLKVSVSSKNVQVDYYRNYFVSSEPQESNTGIVYSYTVDAAHNVKVLKTTSDDTSKYGGQK